MTSPDNMDTTWQEIRTRLKTTDNGVTDVTLLRSEARNSSNILFLDITYEGGHKQQVVAKKFYGTDDSVSRTRELIRRDCAISEHLSTQNTPDFQSLATPPVLCDPDDGLIAYPFLEGVSLQASAKQYASLKNLFLSPNENDAILHHFFLCGRWLRQFQEGTEAFVRERFQASRENDVLDTGTIASLIRQRAEGIATGGPTALSRGEALRLADAADNLARRYGDDAQGLSGIHGDFLPANVIAKQGDIHVIDFLMFRAGIRFYDLSYFYFQLETLLLKPYFRARAINALLTSFCEGYGFSANGDFWNSHPSLQLLRMLHTVTRLNGLQSNASGFDPRSLYRRRIALRTKVSLVEQMQPLSV